MPAKPAVPRLAVAIMAAGKGTRLKSERPKVLHEIGGKPLLAHVIAAAAEVVSSSDIVVIIGHEADSVKSAFRHMGVRFALQDRQLGTGHAVMAARDQLKGYETVLVLSGDVPLIRSETISSLRAFHQQQDAAMTILTALPQDPSGYGRVLRKRSGSPEVKAIVEHKTLSQSQSKSPEINSGIYAFNTRDLWANIDKLTTDNAHREYYLTDLAALLVKTRKRVVALPARNASEVLGANTIAEMMDLDRALRQHKTQRLMASGVSVFRPETVTIDEGVAIGPDTVIEPFVQLYGTTQIGNNCRIRSFSVISDSEIASRVTIRPGCVLDGAKVGNGAVIGPYSHLRPGSQIGENAHVGNFVETKKTRLGRGSKANHLSYLGDTEIGTDVNVGAGTITCNFDGTNKHLTRIEDGAFIGSDSTLVAPVTIGRSAYVAASSCITKDVPADSLGIARATQTNKEGWARAKREARAAAKK